MRAKNYYEYEVYDGIPLALSNYLLLLYNLDILNKIVSILPDIEDYRYNLYEEPTYINGDFDVVLVGSIYLEKTL